MREKEGWHLRCANAGRAFTLLELAIVMSLAALLLGVSTVVMHRMSINRSVDATSREMQSALTYARQIAFTNNGTIFRIGNDAKGTYYTVTTVAGNVIVDKCYIPTGVTVTSSTGMNPLNFAVNGVGSQGGTFTVTGSTGRTGVITISAPLGTAVLSVQ